MEPYCVVGIACATIDGIHGRNRGEDESTQLE